MAPSVSLNRACDTAEVVPEIDPSAPAARARAVGRLAARIAAKYGLGSPRDEPRHSRLGPAALEATSQASSRVISKVRGWRENVARGLVPCAWESPVSDCSLSLRVPGTGDKPPCYVASAASHENEETLSFK
jgi:hypothetical protein